MSSCGYFIHSNSLNVECTSHSCFFVDKCTDDDSIDSVRFAHPVGGQALLVTIRKTAGSEIQQWIMCEETLGLHTAFHANPIIPERNYYWIRQTSIPLTNCLVSALTTVPLITENTSLFPLGAAFACSDQTLRLTSRQSLSEMSECSTHLPADTEVMSLSVSLNSCVCVAITNRCGLLIFRDGKLSVEHITVLLEHSLYTGSGWEDVLACIKSGEKSADSTMHHRDCLNVRT